MMDAKYWELLCSWNRAKGLPTLNDVMISMWQISMLEERKMSHFEELKNWGFDIFFASLTWHSEQLFTWGGRAVEFNFGTWWVCKINDDVKQAVAFRDQVKLEKQQRRLSESPGSQKSQGRQGRPNSLILLIIWFKYSFRVWFQAVSHGKLAHTLPWLFNNQLLWDVWAESHIPLITLLKSGEVAGPEHKPGDPIDGVMHRQWKQYFQNSLFNLAWKFYNTWISFLLSLTKQLTGKHVCKQQCWTVCSYLGCTEKGEPGDARALLTFRFPFYVMQTTAVRMELLTGMVGLPQLSL